MHKKTKKWEPDANLNFLGEQVFSTPQELEVIKSNLALTLTSPARMAATMRSLKYVVKNEIPGAFVECGVWKGGQVIAGAEQLKILKEEREIFLFDTFAGMTEPSEVDIDLRKNSASSQLEGTSPQADNLWAAVSLNEVEENLKKVNYPRGLVRFIVGDVRKTLTIKSNLPNSIAVLRLDTDWFDSTQAELEYLYPLLSIGGVLLIDDYGHWNGAKLAAEKYFEDRGLDPFWTAVDYSCVMHIKVK